MLLSFYVEYNALPLVFIDSYILINFIYILKYVINIMLLNLYILYFYVYLYIYINITLCVYIYSYVEKIITNNNLQ